MAAASARRRSDERHERQQGSARSSDETADGPAGAYVAAGDSALAAGAVPTPIRRLAGDWTVDLHTCEIVVKTQRPWECRRRQVAAPTGLYVALHVREWRRGRGLAVKRIVWPRTVDPHFSLATLPLQETGFRDFLLTSANAFLALESARGRGRVQLTLGNPASCRHHLGDFWVMHPTWDCSFAQMFRRLQGLLASSLALAAEDGRLHEVAHLPAPHITCSAKPGPGRGVLLFPSLSSASRASSSGDGAGASAVSDGEAGGAAYPGELVDYLAVATVGWEFADHTGIPGAVEGYLSVHAGAQIRVLFEGRDWVWASAHLESDAVSSLPVVHELFFSRYAVDIFLAAVAVEDLTVLAESVKPGCITFLPRSNL